MMPTGDLMINAFAGGTVIVYTASLIDPASLPSVGSSGTVFQAENISPLERYKLVQSIRGKYKRLMPTEEFMAEKRRDSLLED